MTKALVIWKEKVRVFQYASGSQKAKLTVILSSFFLCNSVKFGRVVVIKYVPLLGAHFQENCAEDKGKNLQKEKPAFFFHPYSFRD